MLILKTITEQNLNELYTLVNFFLWVKTGQSGITSASELLLVFESR